MSEKEFSKEELLCIIDTLPEFEKNAMHWLIENIDIAKELSQGEKVPESKIKEWRKLAVRRNDHALLALAAFKKSWDEDNTGKSEPPA